MKEVAAENNGIAEVIPLNCYPGFNQYKRIYESSTFRIPEGFVPLYGTQELLDWTRPRLDMPDEPSLEGRAPPPSIAPQSWGSPPSKGWAATEREEQARETEETRKELQKMALSSLLGI